MLKMRRETSSANVKNHESKLLSCSTSMVPLTSTEELYQRTRSCKQLNKLLSSILFAWYAFYVIGMCVKLMLFLSDQKVRSIQQSKTHLDGGGEELNQRLY